MQEWKQGQWIRWRTKGEMLSYDGLFRASLAILAFYANYYVWFIN